MTKQELAEWVCEMIEQLPSGIDREADPFEETTEDAAAHLGGLIWQKCQEEAHQP